MASDDPPAAGQVTAPAEVTPTAEPEAEPEADTDTATAMADTFSENVPWQDFTVHFLVSLPFTAMYSYLVVTTMDALVQGTAPPTMRQADTWAIVGLAVGCSLAIALGSAGRVPDQSVPSSGSAAVGGPSSAERDPAPMRWECVRLTY